MQSIVFIESNTSGTGRLFARAARLEGLRPVLFSSNPRRYPYLQEDNIEVQIVDTQDDEKIYDLCVACAASDGLAGVCSSSEYFVAVAARLAARLGLRGPSAIAVERCRDKLYQRTILAESGLLVPAVRAVRNVDYAMSAAREIGLPLVVKPINGSGSVGVRMCRSIEEVHAHASYLFLEQESVVDSVQAKQFQILIESYIDGPEFSVETFAGNVFGITRKHVSPLPHFLEVGHDFPAVLANEEEEAIVSTAVAALKALDLNWGATHIELRLTKAGPVVVEANPRLAGGFIPELIRYATGVDLIVNLIRLSVGRQLQMDRKLCCHAAIRFLITTRSGTLDLVRGLDVARNLSGIVDVSLYRGLGEVVFSRGDFRDRVGHIIACGFDAPATADAVAAALSKIELRVSQGQSSYGRHG